MAKQEKGGMPPKGMADADDEAVDEALRDDTRPLRQELAGGAPEFRADTDREALASGGVKRGEALQLAEEDDDFEDGRSSGGLSSRSQDDQWARGDVGSRAGDTRSGVLSVEGAGETVAGEAGRGEEAEEPEDLEGSRPPEHRGVEAGASETARGAEAASFETSPGVDAPDERVVEAARGRRRSGARSKARVAGKTRKAGKKGGGRRTKGKSKAPDKKYSQNA